MRYIEFTLLNIIATNFICSQFNPLTAKLCNLNFTHLKFCLADAIQNFKWVKIIQIWKNGGQLFSNLAGSCHILSLTYLKCRT